MPRFFPRLAIAILTALIAADPRALHARAQVAIAAPQLTPQIPPALPAPSGKVVNVSTEAQLQNAVQQLTSNTTIVLAPGTYTLTNTVYVNGAFTDITIRGATDNRDDVVLVGRGMANANYGSVPFGIWTGGNVNRVTIANLTIRDIWFHPIIFNGGTETPRVYNVRLVNAGQQFIKSNPDGSGGGVDNGVVEYSVMEYTTTAKDYYTNGVDVHSGANWIIRHNTFRNIVAVGQLAGPSVLMWNHSSNTVTESNIFLNCARGIAYGLQVAGFDHTGGIIRNNIFHRAANQPGDAAISVNDSPNTQVLNNTVFVTGTYSASIEYRFAGSTGTVITNNITDGVILRRDSASGTVSNNLTGVSASLFANAAAGDLHLAASATTAIDKGTTLAAVASDFDGQSRPFGPASDIGADEYGAAAPTVTLTADPGVLNFGAVKSGSTLQFVTPSQTLSLRASGSGTAAWTASADQPWITLSPTSGAGSSSIAVSINNTGNVLPASGSLSATITFAATGASGTTAAVNLTMMMPGANRAASGVIDTPAHGQAGVTGSIPVTGWAIDDVGITRIRLLRDAVAGEPAGQVFLGDALFVRGARPDVAALNPTRPYHDRAGWGYMLLTHYLPAGGNGTVTLYAYADDIEGATSLLGAKTITCANATATEPFGAIDTPAQGATVSGASYVQFGWALTPQPKSIVADGSTIDVFVDGVAVGRPTYNNARSDIQTLFPGYANTNGAVGYRVLDTTTLTNGVHTIAWSVRDNAGAAAGIGSRYFTVSNSGTALFTQDSIAAQGSRVAQGFSPAPAWRKAEALRYESAVAPVIDAASSTIANAALLDAFDVSGRAIAARTGFDATALADAIVPDAGGVHHVRLAQLDRVEIDLASHDPVRDATYHGYELAGAALDTLPIGSTLDAHTGRFTWQPGLAFGGTRLLVFTRESPRGADRIRVSVTIDPRSLARTESRMAIDTPGHGAELTQPFVVAGWAFDGMATSSAGIDALHIWAHPLDGAPEWIGEAARGGYRPDVAATFGTQFLRSGFGIRVAGLKPGTYDITVYAHSGISGRFVVARSVRVMVR